MNRYQQIVSAAPGMTLVNIHYERDADGHEAQSIERYPIIAWRIQWDDPDCCDDLGIDSIPIALGFAGYTCAFSGTGGWLDGGWVEYTFIEPSPGLFLPRGDEHLQFKTIEECIEFMTQKMREHYERRIAHPCQP